MMKANWVARYAWITAACAVFALGFSLFLQPNEISPGGISGLALVAVELVSASLCYRAPKCLQHTLRGLCLLASVLVAQRELA